MTDQPAAPRLRPFGSKPFDQERLTLSLALQAILYRAGVVSSPELPRWSDDMVLPELDEDAATMARKFTVSRRTPVAVLDPVEVPCMPLAELVGLVPPPPSGDEARAGEGAGES